MTFSAPKLDHEIARLVHEIHASPAMAVVALTGGGIQALAWLLATPGASRTFLEAVVPYGRRAVLELAGGEEGQFVSTETARHMARAAYRRALRLRERSDVPVAGLGCTAALATDHPRRGEHRCHVAVRTNQGVAAYDVTLVKGLRERAGEDNLVSRLVLRALAEACGLEADLSLPLVDGEQVTVHHQSGDAIAQLIAGHVRMVMVYPDGTMIAGEPARGGVLPGSFDPLHCGHEKLVGVASQVLGSDVTFELSIENVDKPPLEEAEVRTRLAQFAGKWPVVVTRALKFFQKAQLFPGCTFVVGRDTAARLLDPRYYDADSGGVIDALAEIGGRGCRFLVAGREAGGAFHTLSELAVPSGFADMFSELTESQFRCDVSSTELRAAGAGR